MKKAVKPKKKKPKRNVHQDNLMVKSFMRIINLLETVENSQENLYDNFADIYENYQYQYTKDQFLEYVNNIFLLLRKTLYQYMWILHPYKIHSFLFKSGNEIRINEGISALQSIDPNSIDQFEERINTRIFPEIKEYRASIDIIASELQKEKNIARMAHKKEDIIEKSRRIMQIPLKMSIDEFKLNSVNNLIFYLICIKHFNVEFDEINRDKIISKLNEIEDFAIDRRMKRAIKLIETIY